MPDNKSKSLKIELNIPYILAWMFVVGLCKLGFWQGLFALIAWPYYLGCFVVERFFN